MSWPPRGSDNAPVGSYPAAVSPYGAYDLAGNVWEWVADWYAGRGFRDAMLAACWCEVLYWRETITGKAV